jgi:hypothetical protein
MQRRFAESRVGCPGCYFREINPDFFFNSFIAGRKSLLPFRPCLGHMRSPSVRPPTRWPPEVRTSPSAFQSPRFVALPPRRLVLATAANEGWHPAIKAASREPRKLSIRGGLGWRRATAHRGCGKARAIIVLSRVFKRDLARSYVRKRTVRRAWLGYAPLREMPLFDSET